MVGVAWYCAESLCSPRGGYINITQYLVSFPELQFHDFPASFYYLRLRATPKNLSNFPPFNSPLILKRSLCHSSFPMNTATTFGTTCQTLPSLSPAPSYGSSLLLLSPGVCINLELGSVLPLWVVAWVRICWSLISVAYFANDVIYTVEIVGYLTRAASADRTNNLILYILQATFIILPPVFFAATIYMCLSRIIRCVGGEHLSIIKSKRLTILFVGGDITSIGIQGGASNPDLGDIGKWMTITGLITQLISFGLFGITLLVFHTRIRKAPTARSCQMGQSWIHTLYMLYAVSCLIIFRSIFRIVEYVMGNDGYPLRHEWMMYAFDTVPMLAVALLFYLWYPDRLVGEEISNIQLENRGSTDGFLLPATVKANQRA